jgi:hypothetical protein
MANSRANASGWLFGEILTETQANQMDEGQARAVDMRAGHLEIETHSVTRFMSTVPAWRSALDVHLLLNSPSAVFTLSTTNVEFWWPIWVPSGAIITGWSLPVRGAAGHVALPASKPIIRLRAGGTGTLVGDPSPDVASYEASHTISQSGLSFAIDAAAGPCGYLEITTESGANSLPNLFIGAPSITFLVSKLDEG